MPLARFLRQLTDHGRVRVAVLEADDPCDVRAFGAEAIGELHDTLTAIDAIYRAELPGQAPTLDLPSARWGTIVMFRACQFVISRDVSEPSIRRALAVDPDRGSPPTASRSYSVDLAMRFLPDVFALAQSRAPGDPLLESIEALARAWPLSSVGVSIDPTATLDLRAILDDASLRTLYLDRIIGRDDATRLSANVRQHLDPLVADNPNLAGPRIAQLLEAEPV